jgi:hypothetical protein
LPPEVAVALASTRTRSVCNGRIYDNDMPVRAQGAGRAAQSSLEVRGIVQAGVENNEAKSTRQQWWMLEITLD